jgi:hypothetical protein
LIFSDSFEDEWALDGFDKPDKEESPNTEFQRQNALNIVSQFTPVPSL